MGVDVSVAVDMGVVVGCGCGYGCQWVTVGTGVEGCSSVPSKEDGGVDMGVDVDVNVCLWVRAWKAVHEADGVDVGVGVNRMWV